MLLQRWIDAGCVVCTTAMNSSFFYIHFWHACTNFLALMTALVKQVRECNVAKTFEHYLFRRFSIILPNMRACMPHSYASDSAMQFDRTAQMKGQIVCSVAKWNFEKRNIIYGRWPQGHLFVVNYNADRLKNTQTSFKAALTSSG